uniref:Centriolar coiled-coil protein of 110 kDa n=1 Tax=Cuerna arida TaxID=1464854 RepID=A0A1B6GYZ2_9HEMI
MTKGTRRSNEDKVKMASIHPQENGFSSCIKIAGMSILPPLITEERRKELNEDKAKAISIEKKLVRKRSSIDSGVMTGSYIENFKNSELKQTSCQLSTSDLTRNGNDNFIEFNVNSQPSEANGDANDSFLKSALEDPYFKEYFYNTADRVYKSSNHNGTSQSSQSENISCDSFLKSALEDTEFREFFYTTAEKIFKDNEINSDGDLLNNKPLNLEINSVICNGDTVMETYDVSSELSQYLKSSESLEVNICDNPSPVTTSVDSDPIHKPPENMKNIFLPDTQKESQSSPPHAPRLVRRNSYTLDSPSPVLLEHMAKENEKWISLTDKKEKDKGLEFKPFLSARKPRKTWNKCCTDHSPILKANTLTSKRLNVPLKRAKTFVKYIVKSKKTINSLPSSSRTSPTHLSLFAHSTECIKTMTETSSNIGQNNVKFNIDSIPDSIKEIKTPQQVPQSTFGMYANENTITGSNSVDVSFVSNKEDTSESSQIVCDTDNSLLHSIEPSDSASQISVLSQSTLLPQKQVNNAHVENTNFQCKRGQSSDIDDGVSLCSSLSLSKFLPSDEILSRPSTAEDLSTLFSEMQLHHERQLKELLEKQHKEKVMLTKLHSNSGTLSSRSTSHLSVFDLPFENNFSQTSSDEKRSSCSRELFPNENVITTNRVLSKAQKYDSEKQKAAAVKITAWARGYLTRRLLKTEKVQQIIDVIKESLTCAFSLQCESQLRMNDLELHERLAHQLSAALNELWSVISAPVAKRMAIIAADRERLKKPLSRPSSAISAATKKSLLRKQKSMLSAVTSQLPQESRLRTKSLCLLVKPTLTRSRSFVKTDSSSARSSSSSRKPWK